MSEEARGWVPYSTPESIRDGQVSALAVAEVGLSIAAYWGIAWAFQTHLHLFISLIAAPLVLLRSDASVATAQRMWDAYWDGPDHEVTSPKGLAMIALAAVTAFVVGWVLATQWLAGHGGWALVWRGAVTFWLAWNAALAGAGAVGGAVAAAAAAAEAGAVAIAGAVAVAGVLLLPGFYLGVWLRSLLIRGFSVLAHPVALTSPRYRSNHRFPAKRPTEFFS